MYCPNCGNFSSDQEQFCAQCGTPLSQSQGNPGNQAHAAGQGYPGNSASQQYSANQAYSGNPGSQAYPGGQVHNVYNTYNVNNAAPILPLKTNRALWKFIVFGITTFGIYILVAMSSISTDINVIATRYDGKKTMHYCLLVFIFSWLTCGIAPLVWYHRISGRIGTELYRRRIPYHFGAADYWLWSILGSLILVGPFIYIHKLCKSMNLLSQNYNING